MAHVLADRVKETTTTTGTGSLTLAGAASGFRAFSAVLANNDTTLYAVAHQSAAEWETGVGTWTTGGVFVRTSVLASSNAGAAVSFSAGTKDVFISALASRTGPLNREARATIVSASAAETSAYSFSVPAGRMGPTGILRLRLIGAYTNTTGANQTIRVRVKWGADTIYNDVSPAAASNAIERGFWLDFYVANNGATNQQACGGLIEIGGVGAATSGAGNLGTDEVLSVAVVTVPTDPAEDTTTAKTIDVTVQLSTATAGGSFRRDLAVLELL